MARYRLDDYLIIRRANIYASDSCAPDSVFELTDLGCVNVWEREYYCKANAKAAHNAAKKMIETAQELGRPIVLPDSTAEIRHLQLPEEEAILDVVADHFLAVLASGAHISVKPRWKANLKKAI